MPASWVTIRHRLVYATALAVFSVWLGIYLQYENLRQEQQRFAEVRRDLSETSALGALAVALARERGKTQAILATADPDSPTRTDVVALRAKVDSRLQPLETLLPSTSLPRAQLADMRTAVDRHRTDMGTAFTTYSGVIFDVNVLASRRLASAMLGLGMPFEYINAVRDGVERSAKCRGLLYGAIALRRLTPASLQAIRNERLLAEDALQRAVVLAPAGLAGSALQAVISGPRWKAWDQEWQALLVDAEDYVQLTPGDRWWTVATAGIDALQFTLDTEVEAAVGAAENQIAAIERRVFWAVAVMVVLGTISVGLLFSAVVRVVRGLGRLVGGIETVAEQRDLGARIPIKHADEFGQIGISVNTLVGTIEGLLAEREAEAEIDGLTRLVNRKGLDRHLAARTNASRKAPGPFGLLVVDIDHFKRINDEFGHLQGDAVLAGAAKVLRESVRPDDIVGRWGGEEFVVVLSGGTELDLHAAAEKVRIAIAAADLGLRRAVTISIGACLWQPGLDLRETFKRADEALYAAKSSGRDRCVVA